MRPAASGGLSPVKVVIALSAHDIPDRPPTELKSASGLRSANAWPAFVFVTTQRGSGRVPERYLTRPDL